MTDRESTHIPLDDELIRQNALLDELFHRVPEGIILFDPDARILRVNPEFTRIFGYTQEEARGRTVQELIVPQELREESEELVRRGLRGEIVNLETQRKRKDGAHLEISLVGAPVSIASGRIAYYGICRDITERKRAEEELKQLVDLIPQVITVLGADGKWIYANRVARDYTGLTLEEYRSVDVIGRVIHPEDLEKVRTVRSRALAAGCAFEHEARLLGKDGVYRWFLFRYNPLAEQSRVTRWYGTATEIESRHQEEERVRQENVRLEERTRIAQELHDTLLQTVLSASMQLGMAVVDIPVESPVRPQFDRILQIMRQGVDEGRSAILGLRSPDPQTSDLAVALTRIWEQLRTPAGIEFRVLVNGTAKQLRPEIQNDICRIARESLVNAIRHSGAKRVELELGYSDSELLMRVCDNGCGIDPHTLEKGRDGHWGLAGMRERSARIGGLVSVSSGPTTGTEVQLSIPRNIAFALSALQEADTQNEIGS
jgi:PAS domain S-box-containing protein